MIISTIFEEFLTEKYICLIIWKHHPCVVFT